MKKALANSKYFFHINDFVKLFINFFANYLFPQLISSTKLLFDENFDEIIAKIKYKT